MSTVLALIFVLGLLVIFHEFGHFIMAKRTGVLVEEFGIGFGPKICQRDLGETTYTIRLFPLGGFVKMLGEDNDLPTNNDRSFRQLPPSKRLLIIGAGPVMNFFLALLLFALIFFLAGVPASEAQVGAVIPDSPADKAGIRPGDKIVAIEGAKIQTWNQVIEHIGPRADQNTHIVLSRDTGQTQIWLTPELDAESDRGIIGIQRVMKPYQPLSSLYFGARQTLGTIILITSQVIEMVAQRQPADVAGPVGIAKVVGEVARTGFINLLVLTASLSVNLGLFNLFPIPLLDGGQIVLTVWESIRGKRLGPEEEGVFNLVGAFLLLTLLVLATYQDFKRLGLGG